jgi:hypothetical protein
MRDRKHSEKQNEIEVASRNERDVWDSYDIKRNRRSARAISDRVDVAWFLFAELAFFSRCRQGGERGGATLSSRHAKRDQRISACQGPGRSRVDSLHTYPGQSVGVRRGSERSLNMMHEEPWEGCGHSLRPWTLTHTATNLKNGQLSPSTKHQLCRRRQLPPFYHPLIVYVHCRVERKGQRKEEQHSSMGGCLTARRCVIFIDSF